jgi:hypothetical protein
MTCKFYKYGKCTKKKEVSFKGQGNICYASFGPSNEKDCDGYKK